MGTAMKTVAIVGGGFSGSLVAVNLARLAGSSLQVVLINHGRPVGRGIAYGTKRPEHLLNVVARNMSALADHPNHFVDWLRTRCEFADLPEAALRESFVPRSVYGDYLRGLLQTYAQPVHSAAQVHVEFVDDEAVDVRVTDRGLPSVVLSGGGLVHADKVVLRWAIWNLPPSAPPTARRFTTLAT